MTKIFNVIACVALMAAASPILAQDDTTDQAATTEQQSDALGLSLGQAVDDPNRIGATYTKEVSGDWEVRCVRTEDGKDPCQMYQLLLDQSQNAVAEINMFPLTGSGAATAGATIITPLETLLTEQITLAIDGGAGRRYPFTWCSQVGCVSRVGFTDAEVDALKAGSSASLSIVPVAAADQQVILTVSLKGFTAAYKSVSDIVAALQE